MGIIWARDFSFLFDGPEMQQSERNEEADAAIEDERLRSEGQRRARGSLEVDSHEDVGGGQDEENATTARHIEGRNDDER